MKKYKFVFTVPTEHAQMVKESIFAQGAGKIGNYERCCFESQGQGSFRPMAGARPFLGTVNVDEFVQETRVEVLCEGPNIKSILSAFFKSHPYETPAFDIFECVEPVVFDPSINLEHKNCQIYPRGTKAFNEQEISSHLLLLRPGWVRLKSPDRLQKTIQTTDYVQTFKLATDAFNLAQAQNHHPKMTLNYKELIIEIWTHSVAGLQESDFIFAAKLDKILSDEKS